MKLCLFVLAAFAFSCAATPMPELQARAIAHAREDAPRVRGILGVPPRDEEITIGLARKGRHGSVVTMASTDLETRLSIQIAIALEDQPPEALRWVVIHELVHAHVAGRWDVLGPYLEEGLAEAVAARLMPSSMENAKSVRSPDYQGAFEIVQRIGVERLGVLCQEALDQGLDELPEEWLSQEL